MSIIIFHSLIYILLDNDFEKSKRKRLGDKSKKNYQLIKFLHHLKFYCQFKKT